MTDTKRSRSTIYDLSLKLGIHPTTVSVVLNGTWKKRRISEATAERILAHADQLNYMPNMHAQGLRKGESGLIGLIIPNHDALLFGAVANAFEARVRAQNKCPIVVSSGRNPAREVETASTLISYAIEALVVCGATDPDSIHDVCLPFNVPHVNLDLPGTKASSVISDNLAGGSMLTSAIIHSLQNRGANFRDILFVGGLRNVATEARIMGYKAALESNGGFGAAENVHLLGYDKNEAEDFFSRFYARNSRLPSGIFIDGPPNYEGLLSFLSNKPAIDIASLVVGCYDLNPIASYGSIETWVIKQNADAMVEHAFDLLYQPTSRSPRTVKVAPHLVAPVRLGR